MIYIFIILIVIFIIFYLSTYGISLGVEKYYKKMNLNKASKEPLFAKFFSRMKLSRSDILQKYGVSDYSVRILVYRYKIYIAIVLCSILVLTGHFILGILCFIFFMFVPDILITMEAKKQEMMFIGAAPIVMEILSVYIKSGRNIESAIMTTAENIIYISKAWKTQLDYININIPIYGIVNTLERFTKNFSGHNDILRFSSSIINAVESGTSLSDTLLNQATQLRKSTYYKVEEKLSVLSVKLTIPMILFFLVPIPIVILAPFALMTFIPALKSFAA